jgi:hypothetical protein
MGDNSIANGRLVHYNDQHIQVRRDFFDLCAYDKNDFNQKVTKSGKKAKDEPNQECMAKILRLLESLTNHEKTEWHLKAERLKARGVKPPNEPREYKIELAYSTISHLLYDTYGESTIRNSIAVLLQRGYIRRYQKAKNSVPCYALDIKALQVALDRQAQESIREVDFPDEVSKSTPEEDGSPNSTPGDFEGPKSTPKPPISTPETRQANSEVSNSTPNNISKRDNKDCKKADSPTDLPALSLSSEEQGFYDLWSQMPFNVILPKVTETLETHCATLAPHVKTLDQLKSLCVFARVYDHVPIDKDIKLGNLVNALNGWLQTRSTTPSPTKPRSADDPLAKYGAIAARFIKQEVS